MQEQDNLDSVLLANANRCNDHFAECNIKINKNIDNFEFRCARCSELNSVQKDEIFQLLAINMAEIYAKTWGWNEKEKRKELFCNGI